MTGSELPQVVRPGLSSAEDDDLPTLPQPMIRYIAVAVPMKTPTWCWVALMAGLAVVLACVVDDMAYRYQRDYSRWAHLPPRPDLAAPMKLVCEPSCSPPLYCDSSTGKCVADAAIANNPSLRRSGAVEYP